MEDIGVGGRIILKCIFKKLEGVMDWIEPAQDRDRWMAVVNAVIDLCFPPNVVNVLLSCGPICFSERTQE